MYKFRLLTKNKNNEMVPPLEASTSEFKFPPSEDNYLRLKDKTYKITSVINPMNPNDKLGELHLVEEPIS